MKKLFLIIAMVLACTISANAQSNGNSTTSANAKTVTAAPSKDVKVKKGEKTVLIQADIDCNNCKAKIEKNMAFVKGVQDVKADVSTHLITVVYDPAKIKEADILKEVKKLGMGGTIVKEGEKISLDKNAITTAPSTSTNKPEPTATKATSSARSSEKKSSSTAPEKK
jgi:Cu2+-exporting ATPase